MSPVFVDQEKNINTAVELYKKYNNKRVAITMEAEIIKIFAIVLLNILNLLPNLFYSYFELHCDISCANTGRF